jgi:ABC-type lipoprotein release transport system permease subunit
LTRFLASLLIGVEPFDPTTIALVAVVLTRAGILGCGIPALRATNVDPIVVLRNE